MVMKTLPRGSGQQSAEDSAPVVIATGSSFPLATNAATESTLNDIKTKLNTFTLLAVAAAQAAFATVAEAVQTLSIMVGWDSANSVHKEIAVSATGEVKTLNADLTDKLSGSLVNVKFDYVSANYAGATSDVYTYKTGGSGGTTVKTVTVDYTDSTKNVISSVTAV